MASAKNTELIEAIQEQIDEKLLEVSGLKKAANTLAQSFGVELPYDDIEVPDGSRGVRIRADQFANAKGPSHAARLYLEMRGKNRGAVGDEDIFDSVLNGGYDLGSIGGLRIAMGKDRGIHRLPNGAYGLAEWYTKRNSKSSSGDVSAEEEEADVEEVED